MTSTPRSVVVVATQGHGDEEATEQAVRAPPAYLGLVASRKRGEAVLGYLAERGVDERLLDRVRVPVGLDLGHTSHSEIAVSILAELVQLRAAGELVRRTGRTVGTRGETASGHGDRPGVRDDGDGRRAAAGRCEHAGVTYYFCCAGCRDAFEKDPAAYVTEEARC